MRFCSFFLLLFLSIYFNTPGYAHHLFDTSFFKNGESYTELAILDEKEQRAVTTYERKFFAGKECYWITMEYEGGKEVVILDDSFQTIKAIKEIDKEGTYEIEYGEKKIVMKKNGEITKEKKKDQEKVYLQRESLFFCLRGYDFVKKPTLQVVMIDFDFEVYDIEISYLKDDARTTDMGSFDCHVLLAGPAGLGKIFAARYKNYYYYTKEFPHYFIYYNNSFMPLEVSVVSNTRMENKAGLLSDD